MPTLLYSGASPYARIVRVCAAEKCVALRLETVSVTPVAHNAEVAAKNPLAKVPSLVLDDGTTLYDSRVIRDWIDAQGSGPKLVPEGKDRWAVLTLEALGNGILDAALLHRYEHTLRPEDKRFQPWIDGQWAKVTGGLDAAEKQAAGFGERADAGNIALACALGWLDFRFSHLPWRPGRPHLSAWYERFSARPAMAASAPG